MGMFPLLSLALSLSLSLHIHAPKSPQANLAITRRFTVRGKVALAFSILSGLLGIATIVWYGLAEVTKEEYDHVRARIAEAHLDAPDASPVGAGVLANAQEEKGVTTGSEPVAK